MTTTSERLRTVGDFLTEYAKALLAVSATAERVEHNVVRIAEAEGMEVQMSVLPRRIILTLWGAGHTECYSLVGQIHKVGINMQTNAGLNHLAHQILEEGLSLNVAQERLHEMVSRKRLNKHLVLLLTGLANASFCYLFGGDAWSMLIVFLATVDGAYLKSLLLARNWFPSLVTVVVSCVSCIIACSGEVFGIGITHDVAIATSVLYLVPGVPFINSVSDMLHGHHLCAIIRLIDAVNTTICLSLGFCVGLMAMQVYRL